MKTLIALSALALALSSFAVSTAIADPPPPDCQVIVCQSAK